MERKPTRFEIRLPAELGDGIDDWRRRQSDVPNRAEAARRLIELGLASAASETASHKAPPLALPAPKGEE